MKTEDPKALRRFCGAVLEYRDVQPYKTHIRKACEAIRDPDMSKKSNDSICEAVISNLLNQRSNPFDTLQRKYDLPINHVEFGVIKSRFIAELARRCGFPGSLGSESEGSFTKRDILEMLFAIADEANECIIKDGAFNHQVAGVALKAIDQAVRLSGMCDSSTPDEHNEIAMDDPSQRMGA